MDIYAANEVDNQMLISLPFGQYDYYNVEISLAPLPVSMTATMLKSVRPPSVVSMTATMLK